LVNAWYRKSAWLHLLRPASGVFRFAAAYRRGKFRQGSREIFQAPVPVIVAGNITTGGTGKTPLVIYLAQRLQQAGYRPGIVSRGYGARSKHFPLEVTASSPAETVGDEAVLLAAGTGCPMVIAPDRPV